MFLTWDNQADAETSIAAVDTVYGCAYTAENGYIMNTWATVTKSDAENKWGFTKPEARLGKTEAELEAVLVVGYTELDSRPEDWATPEGA